MTLVTLWFVNAANPSTVLHQEHKVDRGFARKYLAQLNPAWPLTHIGDFDMTRSATPGVDEFYIGGYPGLSVVQTVIPDLRKLSELPERYRTLVSAADVYASCVVANPETAASTKPGDGGDPASTEVNETFGGFAHWAGGTLKRSFCATQETVFEDTGLPCEFEADFWAGTTEAHGIQLPFIPAELATAAIESWLGFSLTESAPALPVAAFAVDGRPEAKSSEYDGLTHGPSQPEDKVSVYDEEQGYDDYAAPSGASEPSSAEVAKNVLNSLSSGARKGFSATIKGLRGASKKIGDEVRRRSRGN